MACPEVWARLAILNKRLKDAETIYLEQNQLDEALSMYQRFHKWDEGNNIYLTYEILFSLLCNCYLRLEGFTEATMQNGVFWDVTPCGSCKNRRFRGSQRLLHQGDKNR
jgi:hypothetical protein